MKMSQFLYDLAQYDGFKRWQTVVVFDQMRMKAYKAVINSIEMWNKDNVGELIVRITPSPDCDLFSFSETDQMGRIAFGEGFFKNVVRSYGNNSPFFSKHKA